MHPDPPMTPEQWESLSAPALRTKLIRHGCEPALAGALVANRGGSKAIKEIDRYMRTPGR